MSHDFSETQSIGQEMMRRALELSRTKPAAKRTALKLWASAVFFLLLAALGIYLMFTYPQPG